MNYEEGFFKNVTMSNNKYKSHGFTLVELLVTTAVMGVLAALSVDSFQEYRGKVYEVEALNTVRTAITSIEAFLANNINLNFDQKSILQGSDGVITYINTSSIQELLPGMFAIPLGIRFQIVFYGKLYHMRSYEGLYQIDAMHCKGKNYGMSAKKLPYRLQYHFANIYAGAKLMPLKVTSICN